MVCAKCAARQRAGAAGKNRNDRRNYFRILEVRMRRVLLVDAEQTTREPMRDHLASDGYSVIECETPALALGRFREGVDAVVLSGTAPDMGAIDLLRELRRIDARPPTILVTRSSAELVDALREGAYYA